SISFSSGFRSTCSSTLLCRLLEAPIVRLHDGSRASSYARATDVPSGRVAGSSESRDRRAGRLDLKQRTWPCYDQNRFDSQGTRTAPPERTLEWNDVMALNLAQKLLQSHLVEGRIGLGEEIGISIDQTLTQDATGTLAMLEFEAMGIERVHTELSAQY